MLAKSILLTIITIAIYATAWSAPKTYVINSFNNMKEWGLTLGREFPGAKGKIETNDSKKLTVSYDFSKGGKYISIYTRFNIPSGINTFRIKLIPSQNCIAGYRIIDSTGRTFQGENTLLKKGKVNTIDFSARGPWNASWGGEKSSNPTKPFKRFYLLFNRPSNVSKKCSIKLESFEAVSSQDLVYDFRGKGNLLFAGGWKIKAVYLPSLSGGNFKITAVADPDSSNKATLCIKYPQMGREHIVRKKLDKSKTVFFYQPPFKDGGNIRNRYIITMEYSDSNGNIARGVLTLTGRLASKNNFGKPVNSKDIKDSIQGTAVHFSSSIYPGFRWWHPYEKLIDMIADCGYKWIRDGIQVKKDHDGNYRVYEHDLKWIRYAHSKGLKIIGLIHLIRPEISIVEYKKQIDAILRETQNYVSVYELGNEPHNFGWRKKYKGRWNGYEKNGKISKWVKEHLKYTNALADYIKKVKPDVTVIGLGATSPTNFHYLNLGVSKSLDGVVDHPYTYSMPPEKIPFGHNLTKRDGIKIGDKNHSFAGLINSYVGHFKKTGKMRSIWLTEFGFTTFWFDGKNEKGLFAGFTEKAQAVYIVRRFLECMVLPVAAACQYDFMDDYASSQFGAEANFGVIRADFSKKPAFYAIQRLNSLFDGYKYAPEISVVVEKTPLHRSCIRENLVRDWDNAQIKASNGIKAFAFDCQDNRKQKMVAVWSVLPYSREFNNRICTIRVKNMSNYSINPVAVDIITGISYDVPCKKVDNDLLLDNLILKDHPIVIKFFPRKVLE